MHFFGSSAQSRCMANSSASLRSSDAVALRMYGSNIHAWYVGTCSSRYGTSTHEEPVRVRFQFARIPNAWRDARDPRATPSKPHDGRL